MLPSEEEFRQTIELVQKNYNYSFLRMQKLLADSRGKLSDMLGSSEDYSGSIFSGESSWLLIFLGAIIFVVILYFLYLHLRRSFRRESRVKKILGEEIGEETTSGSLRSEAASFRDEGNYRQAVRCEFIALLLLMEENNIIYHNQSRTNREILQVLRQKGFSGQGSFRELMKIFNNIWYGHRPCPAGMYEKWRKEIKMVRKKVVKYEK